MAPLPALLILSYLGLAISALGLQTPFHAAKKDLVSSSALQADITADNLLKRANDLFAIAQLGEDEYNHPTRVIGSKGHVATIEYIYAALAELGDYYSISNQSFGAVNGKVRESRLVIGRDVPKSAMPMGLTPPTKKNEPVYGPLVLVANDGCKESDYPSDVKSAIAFVSRGNCPFGDKSELAGKAGAIAAVIYNNEGGDELHGTLGNPTPDKVATFSLSQEEAKPYIEKLQEGEPLDSIAYMDAIVQEISTTNIVAQTKGGDPENCVMLGGHSDSVEEGPGINDDGSGSLTVLEVATHLTKYSVNNCVRFAWWAGEEEGLLGSEYYTSQLSEVENMKIRLFMDYDMMASPNFAYQIYNASNALNPTGSEELRDLYIDFYEAHDLNYTFIPFDGRSDYVGFITRGIPGGGIAAGAEVVKTEDEEAKFGGQAGLSFDPCYHQACDTVENLNMTAWEVNTKLVAHSVATYAVSLTGFPERTGIESNAVGVQDLKYRGHKLAM
ncbi:MAG: hypothetical protein M1818_006337 [Claussenomyces sp. TS43310]|nr:MAG: hypothetical protein M1818_006337 [Claussenomyces sp. TS43310]